MIEKGEAEIGANDHRSEEEGDGPPENVCKKICEGQLTKTDDWRRRTSWRKTESNQKQNVV